MKRFFLAIGLFLLPFSVSAQALSPWVEEVLKRASQSYELAMGEPSTQCTPEVLEEEAANNTSVVRGLVIPGVDYETEAQFLRDQTLCMQYDKALIEQEMKRLQDAMDQATKDCRLGATKILRDAYQFVALAKQSFIRGATDPSFEDPVLQYKYYYHDKEILDGSGEPEPFDAGEMPLCPYTTDYGPHTIGYVPQKGQPASAATMRSYGCDLSVLNQIGVGLAEGSANTLADEAYTQLAFLQKTNEFATSIYNSVSQALFDINAIAAVLIGRIPPERAPGAKPPPPHEERAGCLLPLAPDGSDPKEIEKVLLPFPDYFDPEKRGERGTEGYDPAPQRVLPTGILFRSKFDFFSTVPNSGMLSRAFADTRAIDGSERQLPDELDFFSDIFQLLVPQQVDSINSTTSISANIERELGIIDSYSRDAMQRMQDASNPLQSAVDTLVMVTEKYLPEDYIPELTFFLARSCVDGHCQTTLDTVAKRTYNPFCHPYASGKYTDEDAVKKCYCDPEMDGKWDDYKKYCTKDLSEEMDKYNAKQAKLVPACMESSSSSSSSTR